LLSQLAFYIGKVLSLTSQQRLVDLGCGEAELTNTIAPFAKHIYGVDHDAEALAKAEKRVNVTLAQGCMNKLPGLVTAAPVHYAMIYNALQYLQNKNAVFNTFRAVHATIQPGGYFYIGAILRQDMIHAFSRQWALVAGSGIANYQTGKGWYPQELEAIATEAGFRAVSMPLQPSSIQLPYRFDYLFQKLN
jgi:ubiquinone/menaquinone biosynthesis C-methylase UbiE